MAIRTLESRLEALSVNEEEESSTVYKKSKVCTSGETLGGGVNIN